ncbi:hypothetical protein BJ742DRAFT_196156 [Cladochytrium replicatum]|nr:hypothetical protein BJ742DRAFT_196156 [Cladochytrium replicatum]
MSVSSTNNPKIIPSPTRFAAIATSDLAISSSLSLPISPISPIACQLTAESNLLNVSKNGSAQLCLPSTNLASTSGMPSDFVPNFINSSINPPVIRTISQMAEDWSPYVNEDPEQDSPPAIGSYFVISQPAINAAPLGPEIFASPSQSIGNLPSLMDQIAWSQQSEEYHGSTSTLPVRSTFVGGIPSPPTPFLDLSDLIEDNPALTTVHHGFPTYRLVRKPVIISQTVQIDSKGNPIPQRLPVQNSCRFSMIYPQSEPTSPFKGHFVHSSFESLPFQYPAYKFAAHIQNPLVSECCTSPSFVHTGALPTQIFDANSSNHHSCCTHQAQPCHDQDSNKVAEMTSTTAAATKRKYSSPGKLISDPMEEKKPRSIYPAKYKCTFDGCTKVFTRNYNLKSHMKIHTGAKLHCCDYCPSKFTRGHDLRRHARLHTNERPFGCPRCSASFSRSDALRRHLDSCTNEEGESLIGSDELNFETNNSEARHDSVGESKDPTRATGTNCSRLRVDNARSIEELVLAFAGGF